MWDLSNCRKDEEITASQSVPCGTTFGRARIPPISLVVATITPDSVFFMVSIIIGKESIALKLCRLKSLKPLCCRQGELHLVSLLPNSKNPSSFVMALRHPGVRFSLSRDTRVTHGR